MSLPRLPRAAVFVFALALVVRLVYVFASSSSPAFETPQMDALYHWQWANAFATGETFQDGPFFRAPLYPWFLGAQQALFGTDEFLLPRLVQCVLGALAALCAYGLGRRTFGEESGLWAGVLVALHWVLVYFDGEFLIPTLIVPLDLAALWATSRCADEASARRAGLAGLLWGLSCIARPNPLILMPLFLGWLAWRARRTSRPLLPVLGGWCLGLALPILPITAANAAAGDAVLISSQAGVNFYIGNNPESDGSTAIVPGTRATWWGGYHDTIARAEAAAGRELRPSEVSGYWFAQAFEWMSSNPGDALQHLLWKARLFVTDWELGNNQDVRFFAWRYGGIARFLPPGFGLFGGFGLLMGLALVGAWVGRNPQSSTFPLIAFVLVYSASVIAFFVCSRFRVPILPVLAIFAARAFVFGVESLRARRFKTVGGAALVVALVTLGSSRIPRRVETSEANGFMQLGQWAQLAGQEDQALSWYRRAVEVDDDNRIALRALGSTLAARGQLPEAIERLTTAWRLAPGDLDTTGALIDALARSGRSDEALEVAATVAREQPRSAAAQFQRGRLQATLGRTVEARESLSLVLAIDAQHFDAAYSLGLIEARSGALEPALEAWEQAWQARARASDPSFVLRTCDDALKVLQGSGRTAEIERWFARREQASRP